MDNVLYSTSLFTKGIIVKLTGLKCLHVTNILVRNLLFVFIADNNIFFFFFFFQILGFQSLLVRGVRWLLIRVWGGLMICLLRFVNIIIVGYSCKSYSYSTLQVAQMEGGFTVGVSDVYQLGLVLYNVLTGSPALSEADGPPLEAIHSGSPSFLIFMWVNLCHYKQFP